MPRRLGGAAARSRAGRLGVRVRRTTDYPDIDDTAEVVLALRRVEHPDPRAIEAAVARAARLDARHAVARRRLGRVRRRQHARALQRDAVLRLRRGDRPADRRRHRARRRDARRRKGSAGSTRTCGAASSGCCASRSRTARGSAAGASTTSTAPARRSRRWSRPGSPRDHAAIRRAVAWLERVQNDDGGWGEDLRSYVDPRVERPRRVDRVADRLGAARAARRRRARRSAVERGVDWLGAHAARRRRLGRAVVHGHRLPRRLLHQLPPLPAGLPGDARSAATSRCASDTDRSALLVPSVRSRLEALAVRGAACGGAGAEVVRTGMGPRSVARRRRAPGRSNRRRARPAARGRRRGFCGGARAGAARRATSSSRRPCAPRTARARAARRRRRSRTRCARLGLRVRTGTVLVRRAAAP